MTETMPDPDSIPVHTTDTVPVPANADPDETSEKLHDDETDDDTEDETDD